MKSESPCENKSCCDYEESMTQNCARSISRENDEPYATICNRKEVKTNEQGKDMHDS
jgi:hypothetical protein